MFEFNLSGSDVMKCCDKFVLHDYLCLTLRKPLYPSCWARQWGLHYVMTDVVCFIKSLQEVLP